MKNNIRTIYCLLLALFLFSCSKDAETPDTFSNVFGFEDLVTAKQKLGQFANLGVFTDGAKTLEVIRNEVISHDDVSYFAKVEENGERINGGTYSINKEINLNFNSNVNSYWIDGYGLDLNGIKDDRVIHNLFGRENEVSLENNNSTVFNIRFETPKALSSEIISARYEEQRDIFGRISRNSNIAISWNGDSENTDGIMAYLYWDGTKVNSDGTVSNTGITIEKAVLLADNGSGNIDQTILNEVPLGATVQLTLFRGSVEMYDDSTNNKVYRISTLSSSIHSLLVEE